MSNFQHKPITKYPSYDCLTENKSFIIIQQLNCSIQKKCFEYMQHFRSMDSIKSEMYERSKILLIPILFFGFLSRKLF